LGLFHIIFTLVVKLLGLFGEIFYNGNTDIVIQVFAPGKDPDVFQ